MRLFIAILFMLSIQQNYAQEIRLSTERGLYLGSNNRYKSFMQYASVHAGYAFPTRNTLQVIAMAGIGSARFSSSGNPGQQIFHRISMLSIQTYLRKVYYAGRSSRIFLDFAVQPAMYLPHRISFRENDVVNNISINSPGQSLGLLMNTGYRTPFGYKTFFEIGVSAGKDIWVSSKRFPMFRQEERFCLLVSFSKIL